MSDTGHGQQKQYAPPQSFNSGWGGIKIEKNMELEITCVHLHISSNSNHPIVQSCQYIQQYCYKSSKFDSVLTMNMKIDHCTIFLPSCRNDWFHHVHFYCQKQVNGQDYYTVNCQVRDVTLSTSWHFFRASPHLPRRWYAAAASVWNHIHCISFRLSVADTPSYEHRTLNHISVLCLYRVVLQIVESSRKYFIGVIGAHYTLDLTLCHSISSANYSLKLKIQPSTLNNYRGFIWYMQ